jgi:NTE family protein
VPTTQTQPQTSLILAGGVVKAAFGAGAIRTLIDRGVVPTHVVAASSGALNGILIAAAIRAGTERDAAERLEQLWIEHGNVRGGIDLSLATLLHRQGIATTEKLVELMRSEVEPVAALPKVRDVTFTVVITSFNGVTHDIDGQPTTTFECEQTFTADDFGTTEGRERIYNVCAASSAFPLLFAPVDVPGVGPCVDGGAVNNSPIDIAVEGGAERVVLIAPTEAQVPMAGAPQGIELVSQLAEILVDERLYRDLLQRAETNVVLARLDAMVARGELSAAQATAVKDVLGWKQPVQLISIRPTTPLAGNVFTGLVHKQLREDYVMAGRAAAAAVLDAHHIG